VLHQDIRDWLEANYIEFYQDYMRSHQGKSLYLNIPSRREAILFKLRWM